MKSKIFDLEQALADQAAATAAAAPGGQTYALLVGISKYAKPELSLQFADADADVFGKLLESPRGGGLPPENVLLLTDDKATTAAVRNGFQDFLKRRAGKNDTVIILIAGHGTVEVPGSKNAFILTYDADPQDLNSTALPMAELQSLFEEQLTKVGRVLLFADVCKAGTIGTIHNTTVNADVQHLGDVEGDLFGLLASRPKEVSLEGPQFGGGHGVFSYYVIKGLEGAADENNDGVVDANELIQYVSNQVPPATNNRQHPREFGTYDNSMRLSDINKPGIDLAHWRVIFDSRSGQPLYLASASPQCRLSRRRRHSTSFNAAINAGRLLPSDADNAFTALQDFQTVVDPELYRERATSSASRSKIARRKCCCVISPAIKLRRPGRNSSRARATWMPRAALTRGIAVSRRPPGFLPGPRAAVRKEIPGRGAVARAVGPYRSGRGVRIQRARYRVSGAGAVRQGDPRLSRRRSVGRSTGLIRCTTRRWRSSKRATTSPRSGLISRLCG